MLASNTQSVHTQFNTMQMFYIHEGMLASNPQSVHTQFYTIQMFYIHEGMLDFLDSQIGFVAAFGSAPLIVPKNPNNGDYSACLKILRDYGETCKLDIFCICAG